MSFTAPMELCPDFSFEVRYSMMYTAIAVTSVVVNVLAAYLVITKSGKEMELYRFHVLFHLGIAFLLGLFLTVLLRPFGLLSLGFLFQEDLVYFVSMRYSLAVLSILINWTYTSAIQPCLYRYNSVTLLTHRMHLKYKITLAVLYLLSVVPGILFFVLDEEQSQLVVELKQEYPCKNQDHFNLPSLYILSTAQVYGAVIPQLVIIIVFTITLMILTYLIKRAIDQAQGTISDEAVRIHNQLFIQLVAHVMVPVFLLLIAIGIATVSSLMPNGFESVLVFLVGSISCYGILGSLLLIVATPSYRKPFQFVSSDSCKRVENQVHVLY